MDKLKEALNTPEVVFDRWVIRLDKETAEFDPWFLPPETYKADYLGFQACLNLKRIVIAANERLKTQKAGIRAAKKAARDSAREIAKAQAKADKAVKKAEARIAKEEEKRLKKIEAKAAKEEAKRLKEEQIALKTLEKAGAPVVPVQTKESVQEVPQTVPKEIAVICNGDPCPAVETQKTVEQILAEPVESGLQKAAREYPEYTINIPME